MRKEVVRLDTPETRRLGYEHGLTIGMYDGIDSEEDLEWLLGTDPSTFVENDYIFIASFSNPEPTCIFAHAERHSLLLDALTQRYDISTSQITAGQLHARLNNRTRYIELYALHFRCPPGQSEEEVKSNICLVLDSVHPELMAHHVKIGWGGNYHYSYSDGELEKVKYR